MADAAVPRARQDEAFERPNEVEPEASARVSLLRQSPLLALLWALSAILLFGFLFFGMIRIGAGAWSGRRMRVTQIWNRFLDFLVDLGASPTAVAVVVTAVAVALIGSVCLVWLALRLQSQDQHNGTPTSVNNTPGS